jgi:hypothetical protein
MTPAFPKVRWLTFARHGNRRVRSTAFTNLVERPMTVSLATTPRNLITTCLEHRGDDFGPRIRMPRSHCPQSDQGGRGREGEVARSVSRHIRTCGTAAYSRCSSPVGSAGHGCASRRACGARDNRLGRRRIPERMRRASASSSSRGSGPQTSHRSPCHSGSATRRGLDDAAKLFESRRDKAWSVVDCASMLVCRRRSIERVFSHDEHFAQAGFTCLLRRSGDE